MLGVQLNSVQLELRKVIKDNLAIVKQWQSLDRAQVDEAFDKMGIAAHELHISLVPKPKHHKYMIENREMSPDHPEFYYHIHPTEDLLKYLYDINANNDPIDLTINDEFNFDVYT